MNIICRRQQRFLDLFWDNLKIYGVDLSIDVLSSGTTTITVLVHTYIYRKCVSGELGEEIELPT